jgi:catechol 2,3-dioxygenase-like lactoylglutathione lyase family enzyme
MRVTGLDHVVFVVSDVEASVRWYQDLLGVEVERLDQWRNGEVIFVSLRITPTTIIDLFPSNEPAPGTGIDHVALVVEDVDLDELAARPGLAIESGPSDLWGARGNGRGVYLRDPDRNLVELRTYG